MKAHGSKFREKHIAGMFNLVGAIKPVSTPISFLQGVGQYRPMPVICPFLDKRKTNVLISRELRLITLEATFDAQTRCSPEFGQHGRRGLSRYRDRLGLEVRHEIDQAAGRDQWSEAFID